MTTVSAGDPNLAGMHVQILTRNGWELTGDVLNSDAEGIRLFDTAIRDVIHLCNDDVVKIVTIHEARP